MLHALWLPEITIRQGQVQHNRPEPVAAVEAQATRRVLLANRKLLAKREDLRMQASTGSKTGATKAKRAVSTFQFNS